MEGELALQSSKPELKGLFLALNAQADLSPREEAQNPALDHPQNRGIGELFCQEHQAFMIQGSRLQFGCIKESLDQPCRPTSTWSSRNLHNLHLHSLLWLEDLVDLHAERIRNLGKLMSFDLSMIPCEVQLPRHQQVVNVMMCD